MIYNDDCLSVLKTIGQVDMILTDPPYKTTKRGCTGNTGGMLKTELSKQGKIFKHNDLKEDDYLPLLFNVLKDGGHGYLFTNNKNLEKTLTAIRSHGFNVFKTLIWDKGNVITNMYYMDAHEYVVFFRKGKAVRINECGSPSILRYANPRNKTHPTEKPVDMLEHLILNSSNEGGTVLDFTMGTGSTGVACNNTGREFIGIEIDKHFFDIAEQRIN